MSTSQGTYGQIEHMSYVIRETYKMCRAGIGIWKHYIRQFYHMWFIVDRIILFICICLHMRSVGLQIHKIINLGSNVMVYKLKHCVLDFEVKMMTF